jgi:hypothetical protein
VKYLFRYKNFLSLLLKSYKINYKVIEIYEFISIIKRNNNDIMIHLILFDTKLHRAKNGHDKIT